MIKDLIKVKFDASDEAIAELVTADMFAAFIRNLGGIWDSETLTAAVPEQEIKKTIKAKKYADNMPADNLIIWEYLDYIQDIFDFLKKRE